MKQRCCAHCAYAGRPTGRWVRVMLSRWPGLLLCANRPDAPGELHEVAAADGCPNFRAKRGPIVRTEPPAPPDDSIRFVPLTQGLYALVDAVHYERVSRYKWCLSRSGNKLYAYRKDHGKSVRLHQFLMNPPKGMVVDHIDGNGLNDLCRNLRVCTPQQNACNHYRRKPKGAASQFIGVYRLKKRPDKWFVFVQAGALKAHLGPFDDEVEAARARDYKAVEMHGRYARLNFPDEWPPARREAVMEEARIRSLTRRRQDQQSAQPPGATSGGDEKARREQPDGPPLPGQDDGPPRARP
jgi:hypothetical protein